MVFDKQFVISAVLDAQIPYDTFPPQLRVSIDTRTLEVGDVFVAFVGAHVDGHDYVALAIKRGAAGLIINQKNSSVLNTIDQKILKKLLVVLVPDTFVALCQLAAAWRSRFTCPVVAITGSVGKTTTRTMVSSILQLTGRPFVSTQGNLNSLIGLPISILRMRSHHTVAVFEVGISKRGDMARAVEILRPTMAVITVVGHSHMEGLGSLNDIAIEKREIFKFFKPESIGIVNGDQPVLANVGYTHPVVKFGSKTINQIQARKIRVHDDCVDFTIKIYKEKYALAMTNAHEGTIFNALAAAGVAHQLGIDSATIVKGLSEAATVDGRFQRLALTVGKGILINDCYNASPESLKAALVAMEHVKTDAHKIAIIGDMLELGVDSPYWHKQIGRFLRKAPSISEIILVGTLVKWARTVMPPGIKVHQVATAHEAVDVFKKCATDRELLVLVKGSHGVHLDIVVDACTQKTVAAALQEPVAAAEPISFAAAKRDHDETLLSAGSTRRRVRTT